MNNTQRYRDNDMNRSISTRNLLIKQFPLVSNKNKSSNNFTSSDSFYSSLGGLVQIERQQPKNNQTKLTLSNSMKCFYQQANATVPVKRQHFILNFVPKRKLNFPKPNAQLKPLNPPSNLIDINKTLFSYRKGNNDKDYLFFRTNLILKYAKNSECLTKLKDELNTVSLDSKDLITEKMKKIMHSYERKVHLIFDSIKPEHPIDYTTWKENVTVSYELLYSLITLMDRLITDIKSLEDKNTKMKNKIFEQDTKLTFYSTTCEDLNKILKKNQKVIEKNKKIKKNNDVDPSKLQLMQSNNENFIEMYRLEEEIRDLTSLLDKNKEFFVKYKTTNEMLDNKKKEIENMKIAYTAEIKDQCVKNAVNINEIQNLNIRIKELEKEIEKSQENLDAWRRQSIDDKTIIKKYQVITEQKNENLAMMDDEINMLLYTLALEKKEHQNTKNSLEALENRIIREKEMEMNSVVNKQQISIDIKDEKNKIKNDKNK